MNRAETIAALVTDKYSGFKDGDEAILEAASDARLEEFRTNSDARRTAEATTNKLETDNRNIKARLTVAEDRIRQLESPMTEEEFQQRAPAKFKTILESHMAQETAVRTSLVSQLKGLGANTEEELNKMSTDQLKTLAVYAHVEVPDFSGRGIGESRTAKDSGRASYAPPNGYQIALDKQRAQQAAR